MHWTLVKRYTSSLKFASFFVFINRRKLIINKKKQLRSSFCLYPKVTGNICRVPYFLLFLRFKLKSLKTFVGLNTIVPF